MVDFKSKLSPEGRDRLEYARRRRQEIHNLGAAEALRQAIHAWHNTHAFGAREIRGFRVGDPVYDPALFFLHLPDLFRRMAALVGVDLAEGSDGVSNSGKCPLCGACVEFDR